MIIEGIAILGVVASVFLFIDWVANQMIADLVDTVDEQIADEAMEEE